MNKQQTTANKTFSFWYSQTDTYKVWLEAGSLQEAESLIGQVNLGELDIDEIARGQKLKGVEIEIADTTLEEVEN